MFARLAHDPAVRTETVLKRKHMDPISPDDIRIFGDGDSVMVVYFFPRTNAIALGDKDVEFVTTLAQTEVKKKFKLEDHGVCRPACSVATEGGRVWHGARQVTA